MQARLKRAVRRVILLLTVISKSVVISKSTVIDKDTHTDDTAYIPVKNCRSDRITTPKQLAALLKKVPNDPSGIRRKYHGQHLHVHAGDWHRWNEEQERELEKELSRREERVTSAMPKIRAEKTPKK